MKRHENFSRSRFTKREKKKKKGKESKNKLRAKENNNNIREIIFDKLLHFNVCVGVRVTGVIVELYNIM